MTTTIDATAHFFTTRFANLGPGETIEIRTFHQDGTPGPRCWARTAEEAARRAGRLSSSLANYYGACPRRAKGGTKADVTSVPGLWADLDDKRFPDGRAGALATLEAFPLTPTWVIDSGGGLQPYWQFAEPLTISGPEDELIATVEGLMSRLYAALGGLDSVQDLSRILRVPGTLNHKYDPPRPVTVLWHTPAALYTLDDFTALLPAPPPAPRTAAPHRTTESAPRDSLPSPDEVREMLRCIPPQGDYKDHWLRLLASVHSAYPGPEGIALCEAWSPGKPDEIARKFASFHRTGDKAATIATLIYEARRYDYQPPAALTSAAGFDCPAALGRANARIAELEASLAHCQRDLAREQQELAHSQQEHTRKDLLLADRDARIAKQDIAIKALETANACADQTIGGSLPDIGRAVAHAAQRGDTLVIAGRTAYRCASKSAARTRSASTLGTAAKRLQAVRPELVFFNPEHIDVPGFTGTKDIPYYFVDPEVAQDPHKVMLHLLPPPAKKTHGGRRTIPVPPEVAAQDGPVRREVSKVAKFYSLRDDPKRAKALAVVTAQPHLVDHWTNAGEALTRAEAAAYQEQVGITPPPPPAYVPTQLPVMSEVVRLADKGTQGPYQQVQTPPEVPPADDGPTCEHCGRPPIPGTRRCREHHPSKMAELALQRRYGAVAAAGDD